MQSHAFSSMYVKTIHAGQEHLNTETAVCWDAKHTAYIDIYDWTRTPSMSVLLGQKHLRWVGHVIHMPPHHLAWQILYGHQLVGQKSVRGQKKAWKEYLKILQKKCNITPTALESLAAKRHMWSSPCNQGISHFQEQATMQRIQRCAQRHQPTSSSAVFPCLSCGKICGSRFGLHSHMTMHHRNTPK